MIRVPNQRCLQKLALKSLNASRGRNIIAILAISLTTLLFTALFTIIMSVNTSFQEANFRQVGGFSHGGFKYLSQEQYLELKDHPLIEQAGLRRFLGMPKDVPFNKTHVEVGYSDPTQAHFMYCAPTTGHLPQEGSNEAATDTKVLSLLGVEPQIGVPLTLTFSVDGIETTQTFSLSGWWEADEAASADHILIPETRLNQILAALNINPPGNDGMTASWNLDVMFSNSRHIAENLATILADTGYQSHDSTRNNYIATGVNWGYTGAQLSDSLDPATAAAIVIMLLLIILTGYLIIYNIFQISVVSDIHFYGLLKTIGTTGRQIRKIIQRQALILSILGIPLGLLLGWLTGAKLTPVILSQLNGVVLDTVSVNPLIFTLAAFFSLLTVFLSCHKPGRLAAKISPIEAVRYTDTDQPKNIRRVSKDFSLFGLARANLGRNREKTAVTILSMTLAVVLFNATIVFTNGFDMDKYLAAHSVSDFILANADYFQTGTLFSSDSALDKASLDAIKAQKDFKNGGIIYGKSSAVQEFVSEEHYRNLHGQWNDDKTLDTMIKNAQRTSDGRIADSAQIYGMETYPLDKLTLLSGDISKVKEPQSHYIAAVYSADDYDNPIWDSNWAKLGDSITLRYVDKWEYYNPLTGEIYSDPDTISNETPYQMRALKYRDINYQVAALVTVPTALSYRYYGSHEFILNDATFVRDTGTANIMLYAFDTLSTESSNAMETFLSNYTNKINPENDYESKATYQEEFESFKKMFLLSGSLLSFIIGLVGILNFFNAIMTGILTRKHLLAMLESIGMTGRQLKIMLIEEGLLYALGSITLALILSLFFQPLLAVALGSVLWFFTFQPTLAPIFMIAPVFILLGCSLPLLVYHSIARQSIVERLRDNDY